MMRPCPRPSGRLGHRRPRLSWLVAAVLAVAGSTLSEVAVSDAAAAGFTWQNAREGMATIHSAAASPTTYVLGGRFGDIWTSTDGASWTRRLDPAPGSVAVNAAVYGGGQFVLVGDPRCCSIPEANALVLTSPDGVDWTIRPSDPAGQNVRLNGVAFGNALYVAVGTQGEILTSPDAVAWTARTSGTTQRFEGVAFGGGTFVAVGYNRTVLTSTDGVAWSAPSLPTTVGLKYQDVTYTGTQFVVVGDDGAILTSPDAATWTVRTLPTPDLSESLVTVTSGGGLIVSGGSRMIFTSPDGATWTRRALSWSGGEPNPLIVATTYGTAGFVAAGEHGTLHSSADGLTWTRRTLAASRYFNAAVQGAGVFCATGYSGAVASSPDGIGWTNRTGLAVAADTENPYWWYGLTFSAVGNQFVAVGAGPAVMTSPDCVTWTGHSAGGGPRSYAAVTEGAGVTVAVGGKSATPLEPQTLPVIATSIDGGNSWTLRDPVAVTGILSAVAFRGESTPGAGDALFVIVGVDNGTGEPRVFTSPDGLSWTQRVPTGLGTGTGFIQMIQAKGTFVLGYSGQIWTSTDGVAWTPRGGVAPNYSFAFGDGAFLAVGVNGGVASSLDGINWASHQSATGHSLLAAAYGASPPRFVAVGESTMTYFDVPPTPSLSITDVAVSEGNTGPTEAVFTASLSNATTKLVTVDYATANGTATAGTDYTTASGTLTFAPGTVGQAIRVTVAGDTSVEPDEVFTVNLSNPVAATIADGVGQAAIADDDVASASPVLSIDDRDVSEGAAANASFRVSLSAPTSQTVTVAYSTADDTAQAGSDYTAVSGTLTLTPGRTNHSIFVPILVDTVSEGTERFVVNLSNPSGAALGDGQAVGTITEAPVAQKIPMYRAYNRSTDYHFFTIDLASKNFAVNVLGFQDESTPIPFYAWNIRRTGSVPLFRMYNPNLGRHFYTAGEADREFLMGIGMTYEVDNGFIFLTQAPGTTELFKLYNKNSGTHLFTADANQKDFILAAFAGIWEQHTSVGFVFVTP